MWEEVNHSMTFNYIINTLEIDRKKAFNLHTSIEEVHAKESFLTDSMAKMSTGNINIDTVEGIQDFVRNIIKTNIVNEVIWL